MREKLGLSACYNLGFSTNDGTVSAATRWGGERQTMTVNPGLPNSYELLFHQVAYMTQVQPPKPNYLLMLRSNTPTTDVSANALRQLDTARYQRAIGVQYVKATEFQSHYFQCHLPRQFDAMIHLDRTHALQPLLDVRKELEEEAKAEDAGVKPVPMPPDAEDEEVNLEEEVAS
jgi:erythromycin esterase-like protein